MWSSINFWQILIVVVIIFQLYQQTYSLPLNDEVKKRSQRSIQRFERTTGHNIMRFGRTLKHKIIRFGKRGDEMEEIHYPYFIGGDFVPDTLEDDYVQPDQFSNNGDLKQQFKLYQQK